jgi:hypothetical protein
MKRNCHKTCITRSITQTQSDHYVLSQVVPENDALTLCTVKDAVRTGQAVNVDAILRMVASDEAAIFDDNSVNGSKLNDGTVPSRIVEKAIAQRNEFHHLTFGRIER